MAEKWQQQRGSALPPGMIPSASMENVLEEMQQQEEADKDSKSLVKEATLSESKKSEENGVEDHLPTTPLPSSPTPKAWSSPQDPETFRMDFSDDGKDTELGTVNVPVHKSSADRAQDDVSSPTGTRKPWSPFTRSKDTAQDLRKVALHGKSKTPRTTPQKLKKRNRVAPSPVGTPTKLVAQFPETNLLSTEQAGGSLQSSSASLLDDQPKPKPRLTTDLQDGRPGSAPSNRKAAEKVKAEPPVEATVVVKSRGKDGNWESHSTSTEQNAMKSAQIEALYSTVDKTRKKKQWQPSDKEESDIMAAMPKLDAYEGPADIDSSVTFANQTAASSEDSSPSHDSHVTSHDASRDEPDAGEAGEGIYSEVDRPHYSSALYRDLKKHADVGNVKLISVRGTLDLPESQTMNFPTGNSANMSPIHYAAATGNKKRLSEILSILPITQDPVEMVLGTEKMCKKDGVDVFDSEGRTPLMHAVHNDKVQCVKLLAEAGAVVNGESNDGSTCLHLAAYSGSVEMVAMLLSLGADGMKRDREGRVPLHWSTNNTDPKCIDILLDKVPSLDVNVRDGSEMTALMWAAFHGKAAHVQKLLEKRADPSIADMDGLTAVHWSVQRHNTKTLQVLINTESAGYRDNKGKTVMHQAAERGCADAVSLIKAVKPTSVNDLDVNGRTPLHWATVCENPEVIRTLLHHRADASLTDSSGYTAMKYALERGLHYCSLLLSKAEGFEEVDTSHLMYGSSSATHGARASNQQAGQLFDPEEIKNALNKEQVLQLQAVCGGSWISKFTNEGKGPLHPRFFWVNPSNSKICWSKDHKESKDVKADTLVSVRSSASPAIFGRKDFDPMHKHKYSFTIFTTSRVLDVVALSSEDYKVWLNGLQLLLSLGSINTTKLLSVIQHASDAPPTPIP